ncbi:MAG TPA: hypothetical protein VMT61_02690 [Candidatus Binataceae bacterium]|nr:hypothetical protein [Candidatus Binataceae bacterium]
MASKLKLVKGASERGTLIYGMRMLPPGAVINVENARAHLADGETSSITMHLIEGTRTQIRRQLLQSIDAFFELLDEGSK